MSRGIEEWKPYIKAMISLESDSTVGDEMKIIGTRELVKVRDVVDKNIKDVDLRRRINASFTVRTKYEALNEICHKLLADDPELACEIAEAAAGAEADQRSYLT